MVLQVRGSVGILVPPVPANIGMRRHQPVLHVNTLPMDISSSFSRHGPDIVFSRIRKRTCLDNLI